MINQHSQNPEAITPEIMRDYVVGRVDQQTARRILEELKDPNSVASQYINETMRRAENILNVDWGNLGDKGSKD